MKPGGLKQQVALVLALLAMACLVPTTARAQSADPTFRSASAATLGGAVNFRAASSATTTGGTLLITRPAATAVNDVMIASIGVRPSGAMLTAPAGWILIRRVLLRRGPRNGSSGSSGQCAIVAAGPFKGHSYPPPSRALVRRSKIICCFDRTTQCLPLDYASTSIGLRVAFNKCIQL
jgi:hypothetical protein